MSIKDEQRIERISVSELILWTENPRDSIPSRNKNIDIIRRALEDVEGKWNLRNLARSMGDRYDFSELPIVVYRNERPVVYDGNRRVILAMLKLGIYTDISEPRFRLPECPNKLPCCVATEQIAIESVWRKHADTGSWDQISRDIFLNKFMKEPKSVLLQIDNLLCGRISRTPYLNQRFVRDEVLTNPRLKSIGIKVENGQFISRHSSEDTKRLLECAFELIGSKKITTRVNRTMALNQLISSELKSIVKSDSDVVYKPVNLIANEYKPNGETPPTTIGRLPRRVKSTPMLLFGGKLTLAPGEPANLYRDILDLYSFFQKNETKLSERFPALIGMSLRLLCELMVKGEKTKDVVEMLNRDFDSVKKRLSKDQKTFLHQNAVSRANIGSLLNTYAHNYTGSSNLQQIIAVSLIVGGLLKLYCSKEASNG